MPDQPKSEYDRRFPVCADGVRRESVQSLTDDEYDILLAFGWDAVKEYRRTVRR